MRTKVRDLPAECVWCLRTERELNWVEKREPSREGDQDMMLLDGLNGYGKLLFIGGLKTATLNRVIEAESRTK